MSFAVIQSKFLSSNQQDNITYYIFQNDDPSWKPKAMIQISHGMCEYLLRYEDFAEYLVQNGYLVCGNDHLGHGSDAYHNHHLGYFARQNGYQYLVQDLHHLTLLMRQHHPKLPIILLGHSMGSFIARLYLDQFSNEIDAAILMGTSGGNPFTSIGISLAKQIVKIKGEYYRSNLLLKLTNAGFNSKYADHYSTYDWLSRDHQIIDRYASDQKCSFTFTASGYLDLLTMLKLVSSDHWGQSIRKDLPILLISGEMDPVGNWGKGVQKVYRHLQSLNLSNLSLKLYPQARHEVLNEINKEEVYHDILVWLSKNFS
jgi:alpha-beta hydrolase superfamily lysophospholipase